MTHECEYCKREIKPNEEFVVEGKYPSHGKIWTRTSMKNYVPPETWGKLYHKACFVELQKNEKKE